MKRLIALIGAVATAFGLYADPVEYYANSFETTTEGLSQDGTTWSAATPWSTELTDAFKVEAYGQGEPGVYSDVAARRTTMFQAQDTNLNVLKLETGTNTLDLAIDNVTVDPGKFYFDQLVKFTGFEEEPTFAAGTKIAVWMSAIETEGTPQIGTPAQGVEGGEGYVPASDDYQPASDDYIAGETNLYVQVGTGTAARKVQIKGSFATETWYRITIKSLGNVIDPATELHQAGFLVFINGQSAEIVDADKEYYGVPGNLLATAKAYYDKGLLFTAIDTKSATLAKVGYQGIGAIDDVTLTSTSPDFDMFVDIKIADLALNGAKVIKIGDVTITDQTSIKVKPGDILVSYEANGPYIVRNGDGVKWTVAADGTLVMDKAATIDVIEAAAKITRSGVDTYYAADELDATIALVQDGDKVTFLKESKIASNAYTFTVGTTIDVAEGGVWTVYAPNYQKEGRPGQFTTVAGKVIDSYGANAGKVITVSFEDVTAGSLELSGTLFGADTKIELVNGKLNIVGNLLNNGTVKAETLIFTTPRGGVAPVLTLAGSGKVVTKSSIKAGSIVGAEGAEIEVVDGEDGWTTYTVKQSTQAFVPSATVATDLATAIAYLKNNYYNKYTNGDKVDAPDASFVKVGTLASDVTGTVSIGGTVADAGEKFSLSIGNNAFLESVKFKIVGREVYVAAVILAIEQVKVTANAKDYQIDSAKSGQLALESFAAVAPTTIAGEGTKFTIVRGDDKPLVKFFFTDTVTEYFVTKKTFIDKNEVATTSYGFTTPDEGGLWLYLGYGVELGGKWDGVTYNYTVYAFGVDKKAITLSMSITDKSGELTSWDDVTDNTPIADLPCLSDADKTALAAAEVSATKVSAWAKGNGKVTIGTDTIKLEAFLLNVENTDTAIAAEKAAFKIPSITVNADGTVTVTEPTGSYNGTITIKGSTTPNGDFTLPVTDTSARFFKAFLGL